MAFRVACSICAFERDVTDLPAALRLEETHREEWDANHILEIERIEPSRE